MGYLFYIFICPFVFIIFLFSQQPRLNSFAANGCVCCVCVCLCVIPICRLYDALYICLNSTMRSFVQNCNGFCVVLLPTCPLPNINRPNHVCTQMQYKCHMDGDICTKCKYIFGCVVIYIYIHNKSIHHTHYSGDTTRYR